MQVSFQAIPLPLPLPRLRAALARLLFFGQSAEEEKALDSRARVNQQAEALLDQYGNRILRLAYSYLHNLDDAEDVLQETLIQFLKARPHLENERHEAAWLLRVAANLSKNRLSYNRLRQTDQLQETLAAAHREDLSFVWEAVKQLPSQYSETIHLFYYEGYSTAEIAQLLGRRESTVRAQLTRARQQLKQILKEAYDFGTDL